MVKFDLIVRDGISLRLKQADLRRNIDQISHYMGRHVLIKQLKESSDQNFENFKYLFQNYYSYSYSDKTLDGYLNKLYMWFKGCGLITFEKNSTNKSSTSELYYYIESTYNNVKNMLSWINNNETRLSEITDKKKRQIVIFLQKLKAIAVEKDVIVCKKDMDYVIEQFKTLPPYQLVEKFMLIPDIKHDINNLSLYLKKELNPSWTLTAARRYANWLHSWYNRISRPLQQSIFDIT